MTVLICFLIWDWATSGWLSAQWRDFMGFDKPTSSKD